MFNQFSNMLYIVKERAITSNVSMAYSRKGLVPLHQMNFLIENNAKEFVFIDEQTNEQFLIPVNSNNKFVFEAEDEEVVQGLPKLKYELFQQFDLVGDQKYVDDYYLWLLNQFHYSWLNLKEIREFVYSPYFQEVLKYIQQCFQVGVVLTPDFGSIFKAFQIPFWKVQACWMGLSPYPRYEDATGFAFVTHNKKKKPASFLVLEKAIQKDFNNPELNLESVFVELSAQGLLLLNRSLTYNVTENDHLVGMWEPFMQKVISCLNTKSEMNYITFGNEARKIKEWVNPKHPVFVLEHPSFAARQERDLICEGVFANFSESSRIKFRNSKTPISKE